MEVLDHKCPNCTANIKFNPTTQNWKCEYCGSTFTIEDFKKYDEKEEDLNKEINNENTQDNINVDMDEYECKNCGAKVIADKNTTATTCVYCGSSTIIKNRLIGKFAPEKIIPFKLEKSKAVDEFLKFCKKKWFAPKSFCDKKNIEEVKGIYIPFWLYDCNTDGNIFAHARNVKTWSSFGYEYTKTDYYDVYREGNMKFDKVPVDGSTKFDDDIMDSIEPYDYKGLENFTYEYMAGFLAEKYDVEFDKSFERAKKRVENSTVDELRNTIHGYSSVSVSDKNVNVHLSNHEYVLLPVWLLNIKYKDKLYKFAMNGQTGKMVGNVPINGGKLALKSLIVFIISTFVVTLIVTLLGGID